MATRCCAVCGALLEAFYGPGTEGFYDAKPPVVCNVECKKKMPTVRTATEEIFWEFVESMKKLRGVIEHGPNS